MATFNVSELIGPSETGVNDWFTVSTNDISKSAQIRMETKFVPN